MCAPQCCAVEGQTAGRQDRLSVPRLGLRRRRSLRRSSFGRTGRLPAAVRGSLLPGGGTPGAGVGVDGRCGRHRRPVSDAALGNAGLGNLLHGHRVRQRGHAPRRELHGRAAHDLRALGLVPASRPSARSRRGRAHGPQRAGDLRPAERPDRIHRPPAQPRRRAHRAHRQVLYAQHDAGGLHVRATPRASRSPARARRAGRSTPWSTRSSATSSAG